MARMWMVRGEGGSLYEAFREQGVVAVGWTQLSAEAKPGVQVWRFVNEIQQDDWVISRP